MNKQKPLTQKQILIFWLPIAATWLMMSLEGPFVSAVIARLPNLEFNLAAYGIAFSIGLFIEAPIMMLTSASVALVRERQSYLQLRKFSILINIIVTVCMVLFAIPGLFRFLSINLMGLPEELARLAYIATVLLIPWPAAIGFRRFYQGLLIQGNKTRRVAYGTVVRLSFMSLTALILARLTDLPGAWVGCAAISVGVTMETLATWFMAWSVVKALKNNNENPKTPLTYSRILQFYYPLALSSMMALGIRPVMSFFVAQCPRPIDSLAVLPVVNSASFILICFGLSFQEVALALFGDQFQQWKPVRRFATTLMSVLTVLYMIAAFTRIAEIWFAKVSDLPAHLTQFALTPYRMALLLPALAVLYSLQRSILVNAGRNAPISKATALEVTVISSIMILLAFFYPVTGAIAAVAALIAGRFFSAAYLYRYCRPIIRNIV